MAADITTPEPVWLDVRGACARARVSESTLLRALRSGRCRGVKINGNRTYRLRPQWVDDWLESLTPEFAERGQLRAVKR